MIVTFILDNGDTITGSIDEETEDYYVVDETRIFGDIVYIEKKTIKEMRY